MNKESFKRTLRIIKRKKWPVILSIILLVIIVFSPLTYSAVTTHQRFSVKAPIALSDGFVKKTDRNKIHLIANRGFSCQAPENTIPAVELAGDYGFDTVYIDVQPTEDGVWIVSHDKNLKTTTDKKGLISGKTYYDIVASNIDKGANHRKYDNLKIPTLDHLLKTCLEKNIKPIIDIKAYNDDSIDNLLMIIEKNGFIKSCTIVSTDLNVLKTISEKNADITLYRAVDKLTDKVMDSALDNPKTGILFDTSVRYNTERRIKKLLDNKIPVMCQTADDIETIKSLYEIGITEFVTNRIFDK